MALLKALIACGGVDVPERKLLDALWPDEEGDAARRALTATLHRLRKLLGNVRSIRQAGGELTLDPRQCWIDACVFEARLDRVATRSAGTDEILNLYGGAFLGQEDGASWAVPMRERLRSKFIHAVGGQASFLESAGQYEQAIDLYERGIDADPLVENFYQGLMRTHERMNQRAEALSAYRRLRQVLSVTLGVHPSAASQRLFESLRSDTA
jgi:DNA-binding SARP family transcriptional activator